ncbi:hypothetical protein DFH29DRAFT_1076603 [Suillus ampliporus]|nr:hypothetical protein DFH29DRAFT_1076603 [Suillus ampliporus]
MLDDDERALLIDCGLPNVLGGIAGSYLTPSPAHPGALRFIAPESFCVSTGEGSPIQNQSPMPNTHSDIYSFGCVMLNVLTEQLPWYNYDHSAERAIVGALYARCPVPIPDHSHLSEKHEQFIRNCTSVRAEGRPSSQDAVVFLEEELRIEDTEASSRDELSFVVHKLEIPSQDASASIQPNPHVSDLIGQVPRYQDASIKLKQSTHIMSTFMKLLKRDQRISDRAVVEDALSHSKILAMKTTARNACIAGDFHTAEALLTQEIDATNDYRSYASRSFVMARKPDWDRALHDALKSVSIQPSLTGYISKGIALCGKLQLWDAMKAFDIAFMFANEYSKTIHFLLLIKAIALFNANQHEDAMIRVQELTVTCPNADTLACRIVEAYLHVQLGLNASEGAHYNEAAYHFTVAVNISGFSSEWAIHFELYEDLEVLFGAGRLGEVLESYRYMMDMSDESTKASCLHWSITFRHECSSLYTADGDTALAASDYDRAIVLYSAAINLDAASDTIFASRSKAKLGKMLWEEALVDAEKVIELNPLSYVGYQLKHAVLHSAQRYDEAIKAFHIMLSKLSNAPDVQIRRLRQQYVSPSEAEGAIRKVFNVQMQNAPLRVLDTTTGLLCDREAQITAFKTSAEYKELVSSMLKHADLRMERIKEVVAMYFRCVMLSHRWEGKKPLLDDIQNKDVYKLNPDGGITKLQSFCAVVRDAGLSLNSMFIWYHHSALTIVYLSDVPPSSKSGTLSKSAWTKRGWTVQEFLAPKVVLFYRKDWTLYRDDRSSNHKESVDIMRELQDATGIGPRALETFRPGMTGAREKFQWASMCVTMLQEDIACSLFGIFDVNLPGLHDLLITTEDNLIQLSRARRGSQTFLLVRPWNCYLLEPPDFADDTQSVQDHWSVAPSHEENGPVESESHSRALQLVARLGQPFGALLLVQQHGGEYKRIASDHGIIAQVKDMASVTR